MYNAFDSRALGRADCYAQRFMRPGQYRYNIVPGYGQALSTDFPFVIKVDDNESNDREMSQHNLCVGPSGKGFAPHSNELRIGVGDMVVWNGGGEIPFAVVGDQDFFNSHRMVNECGFSHAFGQAGDYHWRDAFGSNLSGLVRVRNPDCSDDASLMKWRESLSNGNIVMISDGKADHAELDIYTGQTVFFAIVKTPGISITDARILETHYRHACAS